MTTTLDGVTRKTKLEPTAEQLAAEELVARAREQGLSLTGPDGVTVSDCAMDSCTINTSAAYPSNRGSARMCRAFELLGEPGTIKVYVNVASAENTD
jgi:hypothetical protein